jgi:hypothetical protein
MSRSFQALYTRGISWIGGLRCSWWYGLCVCVALVVGWISCVLTVEPTLLVLRDRRDSPKRLRAFLQDRDELRRKIQRFQQDALVAASQDAHRLPDVFLSDDRLISLLTSEAQKAGVVVERVERNEGDAQTARPMMRLDVRGSFESLQRFVFATYDIRGAAYLDEAVVTNRHWPLLRNGLEARLSFAHDRQLPD